MDQVGRDAAIYLDGFVIADSVSSQTVRFRIANRSPRISSASAFVINTQGSGSAVFASVAVVLAALVLAALVVAGWEAVEEALLVELHAVREKKMAANNIAEKRSKVSIWSFYLYKWALSIDRLNCGTICSEKCVEILESATKQMVTEKLYGTIEHFRLFPFSKADL